MTRVRADPAKSIRSAAALMHNETIMRSHRYCETFVLPINPLTK